MLEPISAKGFRVPLHDLRPDPGPASIETLAEELNKLARLKAITLPQDLFDRHSPRILLRYRKRVAIEELFELQRPSAAFCMTLLSVFCHLRTREHNNILCDLPTDMVHRVAHFAEVKVEREMIADFKRVSGKNSLLFQIAEASLDHPHSLVKDVIYPIVSEATHRGWCGSSKPAAPRIGISSTPSCARHTGHTTGPCSSGFWTR